MENDGNCRSTRGRRRAATSFNTLKAVGPAGGPILSEKMNAGLDFLDAEGETGRTILPRSGLNALRTGLYSMCSSRWPSFSFLVRR